ncbi:SusC/RagA family TonB-linked outer membrane protein [Mucilaginibacter sp. OK098]|uniref:SusC/RagA family TonB-linked outer membrane protein n=1 Tax=Mucilaginibacter sp. OK098 TaxID=1855297 RepID=UPI00091FEB44|nr:SusC/RagA family TonB-linked outer membrane protein [Mucilaginibacter sp. OK098]SHL89127.1 TonB-linked outer membrane protein, SusC/RagA family [Mucilaginibacter sp. OK098]
MKKKLLSICLLLLAGVSLAIAQSKKITGKVTGDDGLPLPAVSVRLEATNQGVLTNNNGDYEITASAGQVLSFSYIGYTTFKLTISDGSLYNVKLLADTHLLTEVVVKDSYGSLAKKGYTGAASVVNGRQNENKPFSSPMESLQGEVAGLNITSNSGQPGADVQVRLRGVGSIGAGSNPLYVIDGAIINSGDLSSLTTSTNVLAGINQDDIDNITVLKDAAATAIYGSRGSNGVIVINTKKGKNGKTQVRFDTEIGRTNNLPLPEDGKPLTGPQFKELFIEGLRNYGYGDAAIASVSKSYGLNGRYNNWYDLVTRNGSQQQYNLSVSGGSDNTRVFASGGYFKQDATTIGSKLKRINGLLNIDHNISKRVTLNLNINASNIIQNTPTNGGAYANPILAAYFLRPFQLARNDDGSINSKSSGATNFSSTFNPLWLVGNDKNQANITRILSTGSVKWNIWDELNFTSFASIDYDALEENVYNNPIQGDGVSSGGSAYDNYTRYFNFITRNQLDYKYKIGGSEDFTISATVGYEAQKNQAYFLVTNANGFPVSQPTLITSINASVPIQAQASFGNYTFDAIYSRASINFKNKYVLSATYRRDGSSVFGSSSRYGDFYSIGGTWNLDEEDFFRKQSIFSSTKLRSSYGTTGNANFGNNNYYFTQTTAAYGANYGGANGQNFNNIGNPNLTWESAHKFDVGVDFGFFNDRLSFDVDYYHNNINKLIQAVPISLTTGFPTITSNVGAMVNKGFEFEIKGVPVKTKDFTWNTSFNIALNKNTVTQLSDNSPYISGVFRVNEGRDFYTYYMRQYAGVDPANGDALWYTDASKKATTNNYSDAARVAAKQADPKGFGGFNNTFTYKGITLSADVYYNFGNYVFDSFAYYLADGTYLPNNRYQYVYTRRWTTPGQITDVPKVVLGGTNDGESSDISSRFLYKGDYIRLKNLTVGYDFKNIDYLKKAGITRLYLYGRGTNLFTKTYDKHLPFDPEVGVTGISNLEVPQVRTFTIGLNVGL